MSRSWLKQDTQINSSLTYDDTLAAGVTLQNTGSNLQRDLNAIRSQLSRMLISGSGNWYDDITIVNGKQRGIGDLNTDLDDIETKRILCPVQVLTDVPVLTGNSYVVLTGSLGHTPSNTIASGTGLGTVVAELVSDVAVDVTDGVTGSLEVISGANALNPLNRVLIRDAVTKDGYVVSGSDVFGLLQVENGGLVQDAAFDDATRQAQITFVYVPSGTDQFTIVPTDVMGGTVIEYMYANRVTLDTLPEDCAFPIMHFIDNVGSAGVTLDIAIDGQVGPATQDKNIDVAISNSFAWAFQSGSTDLWTVKNNTTGGEVEINATLYDNNASTNDFASGMTVDSTGTPIHVGETAGLIQSDGALTVASDAGSNLIVSGSGELYFDDGNQQGSTWTQTSGIKLSELTSEWDDFDSTFGEVSLLAAIISGSNSGGHTKGYAVATTNISADTNASTGTNLSGSLPDYSGLSFRDDVNVYLNGQLLRNGGDAAENHDCYPGDDPTIGDIKFEFDIKGNGNTPDVVTVEVFK